VLEAPGKHLVWLTLDGNAVQRGEALLGEITLREGDKTRYIWLSGAAIDTPPAEAHYCLSARKLKLYPSSVGLMLDAPQLALADGAASVKGRSAFIQRDPAGYLFLYLPGDPASPVLLNNKPVARWTRTLLREKDMIKVADVTLTVQTGEPLPISVSPAPLILDDFTDRFPDPATLVVQNGKTAWKGKLTPCVDWLEISPNGDFRIPPARSHAWSVQLNSNALALPNGLQDLYGGLMLVGGNQAQSVDVRLNVQRPEVALRFDPVDAGAVEWGWPVERTLSLNISNLGRGTWTGEVKSNVVWLEVSTPMPLSCGPWSEQQVQIQLTPNWEILTVGHHEIEDALLIDGQPVAVTLEVTPALGHLALVDSLVVFDQVERDAPLPTAAFQVRNEGGGAWTGTIQAINGWVRVEPDEITVEPGAAAEISVKLLDVPGRCDPGYACGDRSDPAGQRRDEPGPQRPDHCCRTAAVPGRPDGQFSRRSSRAIPRPMVCCASTITARPAGGALSRPISPGSTPQTVYLAARRATASICTSG